jgi:EmrB/QacA subfamily drug resistance transporter
MAIFYQIFPPNQRGMALGLSLMGWSIGPSIGPLTGGYLLEFASWRVVFLMIMPLCGTGLLLGWWFLPPLKRPERRQLDQYGLLSVAIAVTTFLLAIGQGQREGWDSQGIVTLFAVAATATVVFIVIELRHAQPLVELRLFRSIPFVMAVAVMCLTTMAFRSTGPMFPVLMQRILGFEPILVALTMMPSQIIYGLFVLAIGRLSDRFSPQLLVVLGLGLYVATFVGYSGITVWTTMLTMITFLTLRFIAEGFIVSPNNLTALRALPEHQVMMASGLIGLLRSISNTLGPAVSAVLWDDRYSRHLQHYAENSPLDSFGFTTALQQFHTMLHRTGEVAVMIPSKSLALMGRLLHTEASTAAWQDYLLFNAFLAFLALFPAIGVQAYLWWRARASGADGRQGTPQPTPSRPADTSAASRASV